MAATSFAWTEMSSSPCRAMIEQRARADGLDFETVTPGRARRDYTQTLVSRIARHEMNVINSPAFATISFVAHSALLTNHGLALLCIAENPRIRIREHRRHC